MKYNLPTIHNLRIKTSLSHVNHWVCDGYIVHKRYEGDSIIVDLISSRHLYHETLDVKVAGRRFDTLMDILALDKGQFDYLALRLDCGNEAISALRKMRGGKFPIELLDKKTSLVYSLDQAYLLLI